MNVLKECILECDAEGRVIYANAAWEHQLNKNDEDLIGHSLTNLIDNPDNNIERWMQSSKPGESHVFPCVSLKAKTARSRHYELIISRTQKSWVASLFEITERKLAEERLKVSEAEARKLSLVVSNTTNLVIITNREGEISWVNESFCNISGYTAEEVNGRKPGDFLQGPDTDQSVVKDISIALLNGTSINTELLNYSKSGNPYWISLRIDPIKDESTGEITQFIAIENDITEKKYSELNARELENQHRLFFDQSRDPIVRISRNGRKLFHNKAYANNFVKAGEENECFVNLVLESEIEHNEYKRNPIAFTEQLFQSHREVRIKNVSGDFYWYELRPVTLTGEESGFLITLIDIDARKRIEESLVQAKESAEQASEQQRRFLANISHEIRTPLNAVMGFTDVLSNTELDQEQKRHVSMIDSSSQTLLGLLDNILQFTKLESSELYLNDDHVNIDDLLNNCLEMFIEPARKKRILLSGYVAASLPGKIIVDEMRLKQVILNLVSNAIKFTESGHISIEISEKEGQLCITVKDTGIGIEEEKLTAIFNPFRQADSSTTRQYGGFGLGLAITKQIVNAMGGNIVASSSIGYGSCFSLHFPLRSVTETPRTVNSKRVLIHPEKCVGKYLKLLPTIEALFLRKGFELVSPARNTSADVEVSILGVDDPIIANENKQQVIFRPDEFGGSFFNISSNVLSIDGGLIPSSLDLISSLYGQANTNDAKTSSAPDLLGRRILVVEDNPINQELCRILLRDCDVDIAEEGAQALVAAGKKSYDAILMDLQMPGMDGIQATRWIRQSSGLNRNTPIIALTADAIFGDKDRCIEIGMNDYLAKPINQRLLLETIERNIAASTQTDLTSLDEEIDIARTLLQKLKADRIIV